MSLIPTSGNVLNSWKELAHYLGRGIRTAQRWERDLGLPVRRPRAKSRSSVIAISDEIDAWLRSTPTTEAKKHSTENFARRGTQASETCVRVRQAIREHQELRDRNRQLLVAHHEARMRLAANIVALHQSMVTSGKS